MSDIRDRTLKSKAGDALKQGGPLRLVVMAWNKAVHPLLLWRDRTWLSRRNAIITLQCRLRGLPVVHVVGDSHSHVFRGVYPFRVTWLGAATAYNLGKEGSTTGSKEKLDAALKHVRKDRDVVLLVLGEVDSRIHIFNQYVKRGRTQSMEELIDATVERYGAVVCRLRDEGFRVVVHSVPATPYQGNIYEVDNYADDQTRAQIVREFNERLSAWCAANGIEYLDMYSVVSDEQGFILKDLTTDGTHLDQAALPLYQDWVRREVLRGRDT